MLSSELIAQLHIHTNGIITTMLMVRWWNAIQKQWTADLKIYKVKQLKNKKFINYIMN